MRRALVGSLVIFCASCTAVPPPQIAAVAPPDPKTLMPALETRIYELVEQ